MILQYPHPALRSKCEPVATGEQIGALLGDLRKARFMLKGLGLAANQLGVLKQVFVMQVPNGKERVVVNPAILARSAENLVYIEGCLSFNQGHRKVRTRRTKQITATYLDENFQSHTETFEGLEAVCFQHEYDHLQGKTMVDREYNGRRG